MFKQILFRIIRIVLATLLAIACAVPYAIGIIHNNCSDNLFHHIGKLDMIYERYSDLIQSFWPFILIVMAIIWLLANQVFKDSRRLILIFSDWNEEREFCKLEGSALKDEARVQAVHLFRKANQGDAEAQFNLGLFYEFDDEIILRNESRASKWYQRAAYQGHAGAKCTLRLSPFHIDMDVPSNHEKAKAWFTKFGSDVNSIHSKGKREQPEAVKPETSQPEAETKPAPVETKAPEPGSYEYEMAIYKQARAAAAARGIDPQDKEKWYAAIMEEEDRILIERCGERSKKHQSPA